MIKLPRVIDNNGKEIKRLHPIAESISEKIVPLSYATIQVNKKEAVDERTYIELYTVNGFNGVYRTRAPQDDVVGETVTLQLEHAVSEVGDWLIQDAIDEESTVRNAFVKLFGHYRGTKWQLGSFSASESVHIDVDYDNILESLIGIIQQVPKYYMTFNFSTSPWTLSLATKPNVITAEGRLSRNVANVIVKRDDKDLCTRVYVKGLPKPAGRSDDENAIGYMDADTQALYGIVEAQTGGNDLTEAQATRVAQTFLDQHKNPKITCEVDGYDFFDATGETLDKMEIAKKYRLAIPQKSVIVEDYISAINWRDVYNAPNSVSLVIGDEQDPVIDFFKEQSSSSKSSRRSAKKQAKTNESFDQHFEQTDQYGAILLQAGMHLDEHGIIVYARDNINNIGSILDQTATYIMGKVDSGDDDLHSEILQTQSMIRSAVWTANSEVFSYVDQTATYIRGVVEDTRNDLHSEVLQTQTMIRSAVWTANSELVSYIEETSTYILSVVESTKSELGSSILQTATAIMSDVWAASSLIYTHVEQTATHIYDTVIEKSGAKVVTSLTEPQSTEENPLKDGDLWIEGSLLHTWNDTDLVPWQNADPEAVEYDWTQLAGTKLHVRDGNAWKLATDDTTLVEQTEFIREKDSVSTIAHNLEYVNGEWQRNVARLDVRADRISSDVQEKVAQVGSQINQTAREIRSEVHAANSQIYTQIIQTATNIKTEVKDWTNSNFSTIEQTSSSISTAVSSASSTLYSSILQTSTTIMQSVANTISNVRASINTQADRISLVVEGTGANAKIKPASIAAAINAQTGTSAVNISASKVSLDGTTTVNDVMKMLQNVVGIYGALNIYDQGRVVMMREGIVNARAFRVYFEGETAEYYEIGRTNIKDIIQKAEVSADGQTLTLTPIYGNPINFSKPTPAAQTYLSETIDWGGGSSSGSGSYYIMPYTTRYTADDSVADTKTRYFTYDFSSNCLRVWKAYNSSTDTFSNQDTTINIDPFTSHITISHVKNSTNRSDISGATELSFRQSVKDAIDGRQYCIMRGKLDGSATTKTFYFNFT